MRKAILSIILVAALAASSFLAGVHYTVTNAEISVLHDIVRLEILGQVYLHQGQ